MAGLINNIGFGCASLTALSTIKKATHLLDTAYKEGIRFFDTAPLYGNGYSEVILGNFIKDKRNEITITTKFGLGFNKLPIIPVFVALPLNHFRKSVKKKKPDTENKGIVKPLPLESRKINKDAVQQFLERSLKRLKTDYIDNYLLHEGVPAFLDDEAMNYLLDSRNKGIIKKIGIAASYVNIEFLNEDDLTHWDILQYENGPFFKTDQLVKKFPGKMHIYHSSLKYVHLLNANSRKKEELVAMTIARGILNNPEGKILFSSFRSQHISSNISLVRSFLKEPQVLNKFFSNALY